MKPAGVAWPDVLRSLDWAQPWLQDFAPVGPALVDVAVRAHEQGDGLATALNTVLQPQQWPFAIEFIAASAVKQGATGRFGSKALASEAPGTDPHRIGYEAWVHQHAQVPARDGLHDFFNALVWWRWPQFKAQLNALHLQHDAGPGQPRGAVRDALTLLDENGAVLRGPAAALEQLRRLHMARDWPALLWDARALWSQVQVHVLGHALLEQLCTQPRLDLTAHVWWPAHAPLANTDASLAQAATAQSWHPKPFVPLPVRGIAGWSPQADQRGFYDQADIFRPARGAEPGPP